MEYTAERAAAVQACKDAEKEYHEAMKLLDWERQTILVKHAREMVDFNVRLANEKRALKEKLLDTLEYITERTYSDDWSMDRVISGCRRMDEELYHIQKEIVELQWSATQKLDRGQYIASRGRC